MKNTCGACKKGRGSGTSDMWDRAENQITLVLIRHGATKANMEHRYLGKTDEVLSKEGEMQLFEYKKRGFFPELNPVEIEEW